MLTSVREAEQRLQQEIAWAERPKPKVEYEPQNFGEAQLAERTRQWFDLIHLALQTDSTRIIALNIHSHGTTGVEGVAMQHHDASHHGQEPHKIEQLAKVEEAEFRQLDYLLTKLNSEHEKHGTLLDRTKVDAAGRFLLRTPRGPQIPVGEYRVLVLPPPAEVRAVPGTADTTIVDS